MDRHRARHVRLGLAERQAPQRLHGAIVVLPPGGDAVVIGGDQTLVCEDRLFDKPADIEAAHRQLRELRGRVHVLHSAVSVARNGTIEWRHIDAARLSMRAFSDEFLTRYVAACQDWLTSSVGGYRLEGLGAQLFDQVEGDYFTILGLPLLPLLGWLRQAGVLRS